MDAAIVERAKAGDRAAMEGLLRAVAPTIRRFALRMCRNEADADDVLQDALFSIATHLDQFEGRSSLPSWTFALARSACSRRRRGKKNQPHDDLESLAATDQAMLLKGPGPLPDDHAASAELATLVESALDQLPDEYREVLLLRDGEGLTAPEAAVAIGVSLEALKSRLHRARKALREVLRPILEKEQEHASSTSSKRPECPDVVRALSEKLEDDLDPSACAAMEKHVSSCPSCAQTCDALKDALQACRSVEAATLSPELQEHVRATIARWLRSRSPA